MTAGDLERSRVTVRNLMEDVQNLREQLEATEKQTMHNESRWLESAKLLQEVHPHYINQGLGF